MCSRIIPENQQGFLKGGRIYASLLSLYALVEAARLQRKPLYVTFVDVKKAFPSAKRELLLQIFSQNGASDELVRATWALYHDAQASVRGSEGYGLPFPLAVGTREGGAESPHLYIIFVCNLIAFLDSVALRDGSARLNGTDCRALQLADDLAIIAQSAEDQQRLLDAWERFCDMLHIETQTKKTESVVFCSDDDDNVSIVDGSFVQRVALARGRRSILDDINFTYKRIRIKVVESFVYLGALFHWKESAEAAWADRENTAFKAFGSLCGSLCNVPFLPLSRIKEVLYTIIGGVYLFGAEPWAPFIPRAGRTPGSRISRDVLAWIMGLGSAKLERCRGWFELRELDDMATGMALRAIDDAISHGGLLKKAILQLQSNFENAGRKANKTWMGRLHTIVRATWPRFRVITFPNLQLCGVPDREPGVKLSKHFSCAAWLANWKKRQLSLLNRPPAQNQQDYLLYVLLDHLCTRLDGEGNALLQRPLLQQPIFTTAPVIGIDSCRKLFRFLSGMGDFGRVNAHRPRWKTFPGLRESDTHKRTCLFCWTQSWVLHEDSEWHSVFSCPVGNACRLRFKLALSDFQSSAENSESPTDILEIPSKCLRLPTSSDLARLINFCRSDGRLAGELARFVVDLDASRKRAFAKLTVRDLFPEST